MFPFLIKKAFFDMWDNLFRICALNLGYVLIISGTGFLLSAVPPGQLAYLGVLVIGSAALSVFTMGTTAIASNIADYKLGSAGKEQFNSQEGKSRDSSPTQPQRANPFPRFRWWQPVMTAG